ncbi:MAG: ABC transporter ATP-binding protein [Acidobacteriota bacterium]|nr:ABC transporter ATP-binding protein [Acidobacteriota bacterium]
MNGSGDSRGSRGSSLVEMQGVRWDADGQTVVGPLDLQVREGECLMLVGPNGAGKTSLLRLVTGLLEPSAGELRLRGEPYGSCSRRQLARAIAYVPQIRPARVPLEVGEVVLQGRYPHRKGWQLAPSEEDFAAVEAALERVGIEHLRRRRLDRLSGGERQAAYIAAALAQEGELLVLDEPTTHLDPKHQREIAALLLRLKAQGAPTVLAATHDLALASQVADRVLALRRGAILADGEPRELMQPEMLRQLFDASFELLREGARPIPGLLFDADAAALREGLPSKEVE